MSYAIDVGEMTIAEDSLIADVQFAIHNLLESKGVSRAELARRLNVSESYISQLFKDDTRNLTLRTVARIFRALNEEPRISSEVLDRLIPVAKKHAESVSSTAKHRTDIVSLILNEARLSEMEFYFECNNSKEVSDFAVA